LVVDGSQLDQTVGANRTGEVGGQVSNDDDDENDYEKNIESSERALAP